MKTNKKLKKARKTLKDLKNWPSKSYDRRTEEGYPSEFMYDQFSYERIVSFYRREIKKILKELE